MSQVDNTCFGYDDRSRYTSENDIELGEYPVGTGLYPYYTRDVHRLHKAYHNQIRENIITTKILILYPKIPRLYPGNTTTTCGRYPF